jgi:hypothetical protein
MNLLHAMHCSVSLLILIAWFVTLDPMVLSNVTPMHHLMIMVSSAASGPRE